MPAAMLAPSFVYACLHERMHVRVRRGSLRSQARNYIQISAHQTEGREFIRGETRYGLVYVCVCIMY